MNKVYLNFGKSQQTSFDALLSGSQLTCEHDIGSNPPPSADDPVIIPPSKK